MANHYLVRTVGQSRDSSLSQLQPEVSSIWLPSALTIAPGTLCTASARNSIGSVGVCCSSRCTHLAPLLCQSLYMEGKKLERAKGDRKVSDY